MKKASTVIPTDPTPLPNDDAVGRVRAMIERYEANAKAELEERYAEPYRIVAADLRSLLNRLGRAEGGGDEGVSRSQPCAETGHNSPSSPDARSLLECRFCGAAPYQHPQHMRNESEVLAVWCEACGAAGPECRTEAEAIAAWNHRNPSQPHPSTMEEEPLPPGSEGAGEDKRS